VAEQPQQPRLSVWLEQPRRRRGSKAPDGLSRERIVRAAMRLLDAEGLNAFSMRKLAAELGVTPMSVYWYVENKADLIELALDEVFLEVALPERPEGEPDPDRVDHLWSHQLKELAREFRRVLVAHPWVTAVMGHYFNLGPASVRLSRAAIDLVERTGLPPKQCGAALLLVVQFAFGFSTVEANWSRRAREAGMTEDELYRIAYDAIEESSPEIMEQAERVVSNTREDISRIREEEFELALDCVVAGIDAMARAAQLAWESGAPAEPEKHRSDLRG
jgi:AcrR family transcriptional regulator